MVSFVNKQSRKAKYKSVKGSSTLKVGLLLGLSYLFAGCQIDSSSENDGALISGSGDSRLSLNGTQLLVAEQVSSSVLNKNSDLGSENIKLLNDNQIDPENDGTLNSTVLTNAARTYLGVNYDGIVVLDWESTGLTLLKTNVGSAAQINQIQEYVRAIQIVKSICPKARVGYYALPMRYYYNRDSNWHAINDSLAPIIAVSDALFPSVYDFYEDGVEVSAQSDINYMKENVQEALRISQGLPVYPFVWPRYHPSNARIANRSIPSIEFQRNVYSALTARYDGKKPAGIVWWGADKYWASIASTSYDPSSEYFSISQSMQTAFSADKLTSETYDQYVDRIHQRVLNDFRSAMIAAQSIN